LKFFTPSSSAISFSSDNSLILSSSMLYIKRV